jgi:hypothetical protein
MSNAYLFVICLFASSFAGCLGIGDLAEENSSSSLEDAFNDFIESINAGNEIKYCKYIAYTIDDETNTIILANNTELDECAEDREEDDDYEYKLTTSNYSDENLDYKAANNSGFVYSVNFTMEECEREDEFEPWDCEESEMDLDWVEVSGQWLYWWDSFLEQGESAPIATFIVEESSGGEYHVKVIKVSKQEDLAEFSFFLKDETGSTYVGGNGFGEVALQMIDGNEHGIENAYDGENETLERRANNISADDGSEFPVHFSDNDRDGKLSAGDEFTVYGTGNSANGPASSGWKLDIQYDSTGDIVGFAKME